MKIFKELFKIISSKQITQTLLNILILLFIILLINTTTEVWGGFFSLVWQVIKPFAIAFTIAFVLNPLINLVEKYVKKRALAMLCVYVGGIAAILIIIILAIPMIYNSIFELYPAFEDGLIYISKLIEKNSTYDISHLVTYVQTQVSAFLKTTAVLDTTFEVLNQLLINATNFLIYIILAIYISSQYDGIRQKIKKIASKLDSSMPLYLTEINTSLNDYIKAFSIGALIQGLSTGFIYIVVGHPNWALIAIVSAISSVIPYIGPILANVLGVITSITLGTSKLLTLFLLIFIQSNIVPYVIQPKIYSTKINLSIMWVLFGILTGSTLFGPWGMVIAMPLIVTCKITYRVYREHHPL